MPVSKEVGVVVVVLWVGSAGDPILYAVLPLVVPTTIPPNGLPSTSIAPNLDAAGILVQPPLDDIVWLVQEEFEEAGAAYRIHVQECCIRSGEVDSLENQRLVHVVVVSGILG